MDTVAASKSLKDDQLQVFNTEQLTVEMWDDLVRLVKQRFGSQPFTFLDVGGGNGRFTDALLDHFPNARGTVLDNGEALLRLNKCHPRKRIVVASAEAMEQEFPPSSFDLVHFNWVLHHLLRDTYRTSLQLQLQCLRSARRLLREQGHVSVFENLYEGHTLSSLPSWLIFQLTSSRQIAWAIRRMGANTAGCGVCFLGKAAWERQFAASALAVQQVRQHAFWRLEWYLRVFLHIKSIRIGHFWMSDMNSMGMRST
jgi:ubiquinone/menaquinone biosynthesis C-methylase UbiE